MKLRRGRTKTILESSRDAALLAVEVYNKPRTTFRSEAYISLMVMAWTRLLHAYFNAKIGDTYYYRKPGSNRYETIDGERKAWELKTCINKYGNFSDPVKKNLQFFIKLRNKIEHRHIEKRELDFLIFGECQAFLYNYETCLTTLFGIEYALHESLVYSLQLSHLRNDAQAQSNKSALAKDLQELVGFIEKFRATVPDDVYGSQEFSIRLIQIPRISNTKRGDAAIEFVKWDELSEDDKSAYSKIAAIIKDKKVRIEGTNVGKLKPGTVVKEVQKQEPEFGFSLHTHTCLCRLFSVRPPSNAEDPFETIADYCHYDEAHNDYVYRENWISFIVKLANRDEITKKIIHTASRLNEKWIINDYK